MPSSFSTPAFDPKNRRDLTVMRKRIMESLNHPKVATRVEADLMITLGHLHIAPNVAKMFIDLVLSSLMMSCTGILRTEESIRDELALLVPDLATRLSAALSDRAALVTSQLHGVIDKPDARIADLGCGDGKVAQLALASFQPSYIVGYEVLDYRAEGVTIPIRTYNGFSIPLVGGEEHSFDYILLTNVLHHAELNGWLICEAHRLLKPGGRAVVHETVPTPAHEDDPLEVCRLFILDYIYNRIFHDADILNSSLKCNKSL